MRHHILLPLLLLCCTLASSAQGFVVFSVRGNVRRVEGTTQTALNVRDVVKGSDIVDIPMRGALVLVDQKNSIQLSLTKPGHASVKAMTQEDNNSISRISSRYLAYVRSQLNGQEYRQVRNCSDPATVTRDLKVADSESNDPYEDFRVAFNSEGSDGKGSLRDEFEAERRKLHEDFDRERERMYEEFERFREESMEEYLAFVSEGWEEMETNLDKAPTMPKIVPPVFKADEQQKPQEDKPVTISKVLETEVIPAQPLPPGRIRERNDKECQTVAFTFYGTDDRVRFNAEKTGRLKDITEESVAAFLKELSEKRNDNLLVDCLTLRSKYQLSDWAYLQMLRSIGEACYGKGSSEAVLLMAYLYCQSGYKMRLGHDGERIHMLYASRSHIFDQPYITIEGDKYYGVDPLPRRLVACRAKYPREQQLSLDVTTGQLFAMQPTENRIIASQSYDELKVETCVNQNLLDFYSSYPSSYDGEDVMSRWVLYANCPLEREVADQLYPQLNDLLEGFTEREKVEAILNLIQTGLEYAYDDEVWGEDRAFFPEESLFYPGCDCEDRSILFTRLVRDLLGLKCLLVHYPGHLAAAVHFNDDVKGDYIMHKGEKFVVCDPTYIRANVGMTMPDMDNSEAEIVLLDK